LLKFTLKPSSESVSGLDPY